MMKPELCIFLEEGQEFKIPFLVSGVLQDEAIRNKNIAERGKDALCARCSGTGNEFFFHYKRCTACGGSGIKKDAVNASDSVVRAGRAVREAA